MKTEKPELLLLDIMLPEEDGISILKKLRSKSDTKDLPVIMLTAKGCLLYTSQGSRKGSGPSEHVRG